MLKIMGPMNPGNYNLKREMKILTKKKANNKLINEVDIDQPYTWLLI